MRDQIYSRNAVYETLRAKRREIFRLQIGETVQETEKIKQILKLAAEQKIRVEKTPRARLDKIHEHHQGVVLEAETYPYSDVLDILEKAKSKNEPLFVLMLDSLQDPQNFGTLIRTAEALGVHGVVIPLARSVEVTPTVVNASSGASELMRSTTASRYARSPL